GSMAPVPDTTLADLRASLEAEQGSLRAQLTELGFGVDGLSFDENFADSGQVTAERGEATALAGTLREALAEVDHALTKLEAGTFGTCERCGEPISPARLEAMPAARYCIISASKRCTAPSPFSSSSSPRSSPTWFRTVSSRC